MTTRSTVQTTHAMPCDDTSARQVERQAGPQALSPQPAAGVSVPASEAAPPAVAVAGTATAGAMEGAAIPATTLLTCHDLYAGYANRMVLQGISLAVAPGELVGLLGPNGSGKTTLLLALSGVLTPRQGTIHHNGTLLTDLTPRQRALRMATVPQRPEQVPDLPVRELVLMGRYPHTTFLGGYTQADHDAAAAALAATDAAPLAQRSAATLSGGELQRVLMARALAQGTDTLLLDEATAGLDIARMVELYDLLHQRHRQGLRIIAAMHDLNLAALYCTRLVLLKHGRILHDGPTETVFTAANLEQLYDTPVCVMPHPVNGRPQALLLPGHQHQRNATCQPAKEVPCP